MSVVSRIVGIVFRLLSSVFGIASVFVNHVTRISTSTAKSARAAFTTFAVALDAVSGCCEHTNAANHSQSSKNAFHLSSSKNLCCVRTPSSEGRIFCPPKYVT